MKRYLFPFGTSNITLEVEAAVHFDTLAKASKLIKDLQEDINHNFLNSSAYRFNEAKAGLETKVSPEFILFLKANLRYFQKFSDGFNPFVGLDKALDNFENLFELGLDYVLKNYHIMIDTSKLRNAYILDLLAEFLKVSKVTDFLISYNGLFISAGKPKEIILKVDELRDLKTKLFNKATALNLNKSAFKKEQRREGFGNMYKVLVHKYSVTKNNSLIENRVMGEILKSLNTKDDYLIFANEWKTNLVLIDLEDKIHKFGPTV